MKLKSKPNGTQGIAHIKVKSQVSDDEELEFKGTQVVVVVSNGNKQKPKPTANNKS